MIETWDVQRIKSELLSEVIRVHGQGQFRALGTSMMPAVWPGDILTVRREDIAAIERGQIVLFMRHGSLFAHRITRKISDGERVWAVTRGDRLSQDDLPISDNELLGVVTAIVRGTQAMTPDSRPSLWSRVVSFLSRYSEWPVKILLASASQ